MRLSIVIMMALLLASCSSMHPFWRPWTPEEREEQHRKELADYERRQRQAAEREAIVQALGPEEVRGCSHLGFLHDKTVAAARGAAVDLGGDYILAQSYPSYEIRHERDLLSPKREHVIVVPRTQVDYAVYRCDEPRK